MKKYRAVLVGYGNMGKNWRDVLQKRTDVEIVGVVDVAEKNRLAAKEDFNLSNAQVMTELGGAIDNLLPDIILDCSAPVAHAANATVALSKGCNILGEKPIALSLKEAQEVVRLCREKRKLYMINQNYRWRPMMRELKKYLRDGELGAILAINVVYAQNFTFNDTFRYQIANPFLLDMAVHHFDLIRSLTGVNYESVYCVETKPAGTSFEGGSSASAIFIMRSGVVFTYQGSWSEIGVSTSFMGTWRIACERGTIVWDGSGNPKIEGLFGDKLTIRELEVQESGAANTDNEFLYELEASLSRFLAAMRDEETLETSCEDNIHTLDMVLGAIESSAQKRLIKGMT